MAANPLPMPVRFIEPCPLSPDERIDLAALLGGVPAGEISKMLPTDAAPDSASVGFA